MKLSKRHSEFVDFYFSTKFNKTEAARLAGYSEKAAKQIGWNLCNKPHIKEEIERRGKELAETAGATVNNVMVEICKIAFANPEDLFDEEGKLKNINDIDLGLACAIADIEATKKVGIIKIKIKPQSKLAALDLLGNFLGMKKDKLEAPQGFGVIVVPAQKPVGAPVPVGDEGKEESTAETQRREGVK